jgi:hypothetical protein
MLGTVIIARQTAASQAIATLTDHEMPNHGASPAAPSFVWLFLGKVILLLVTIVIVWVLYAYLHAYRLDWLGWFYVKLLPLTNSLYAFVETYLPDDVKYKIRGAITDDLGQRSLFLLLLTAVVELSLYSLFKGLKAVAMALGGFGRRTHAGHG